MSISDTEKAIMAGLVDGWIACYDVASDTPEPYCDCSDASDYMLARYREEVAEGYAGTMADFQRDALIGVGVSEVVAQHFVSDWN